MIFKCDVTHEAGAVRGNEIEHQPRGLTLRCVEHESLVQAYRPFGVEHDSGAALHDQAIAKRLHQTAALLASFGWKLEGCLWQIDHHAVRVGERESSEINLAVQIDHETGLLVVPPMRISVAITCDAIGAAKASTGAPLSAAMPTEPQGVVHTNVPTIAIARTVTNPDPFNPLFNPLRLASVNGT